MSPSTVGAEGFQNVDRPLATGSFTGNLEAHLAEAAERFAKEPVWRRFEDGRKSFAPKRSSRCGVVGVHMAPSQVLVEFANGRIACALLNTVKRLR